MIFFSKSKYLKKKKKINKLAILNIFYTIKDRNNHFSNILFSPVTALNLVKSMTLTFCSELSLCHTIQSFSDPVNPVPNKPLFLCVCLTFFLKTPQEKEILLVTGNFSFSHSVFYPVVCKLFQIEKAKNLSYGEGWEGFWKHCRTKRKCW